MLLVVEKTRGVMLVRFKLFAINCVLFYWLPNVVCGWWRCLWNDNTYRAHLGENSHISLGMHPVLGSRNHVL